MSFINNIIDQPNTENLKIIDIARKIEEFSHKTNTTIDLDEWAYIFNIKKIYHFSIDENNNEYVINYGQLRIKYYHFVIANLNLFDNASILAYYIKSKNPEKLKKYQNYYEFRKKFINQFLKK